MEVLQSAEPLPEVRCPAEPLPEVPHPVESLPEVPHPVEPLPEVRRSAELPLEVHRPAELPPEVYRPAKPQAAQPTAAQQPAYPMQGRQAVRHSVRALPEVQPVPAMQLPPTQGPPPARQRLPEQNARGLPESPTDRAASPNGSIFRQAVRAESARDVPVRRTARAGRSRIPRQRRLNADAELS